MTNHRTTLLAARVGGRRRLPGEEPPAFASPVELFTGGFTGVLFDAALSEMYTDAGVTVASIGQAVHSFRNLANNGLVSQTTLAARGQRVAAGILSDGIDDFYPTGVAFGASGPATAILAGSFTTTSGSIVLGANSGSGSSRYRFFPSAAGIVRRRYGTPEANIGTDIRAFSAASFGVSRNSATPRTKSYFNGVVVEDLASTFDASTFGTHVMGNNNAGTAQIGPSFTLRGLIIINKVLTDHEVRTLHRDWTA